MTRGGVYERREMVISSVGVSVAASLLLRPETVLADVVVELVHAQAAGGAGVGSCKGNISVNLTQHHHHSGRGTMDSSILTIISSSPTMDQNLHQFVS